MVNQECLRRETNREFVSNLKIIAVIVGGIVGIVGLSIVLCYMGTHYFVPTMIMCAIGIVILFIVMAYLSARATAEQTCLERERERAKGAN